MKFYIKPSSSLDWSLSNICRQPCRFNEASLFIRIEVKGPASNYALIGLEIVRSYLILEWPRSEYDIPTSKYIESKLHCRCVAAVHQSGLIEGALLHCSIHCPAPSHCSGHNPHHCPSHNLVIDLALDLSCCGPNHCPGPSIVPALTLAIFLALTLAIALALT